MFIVCLTIFSAIMSQLQDVSYVKVHVYCVFDYFLFNLVFTSVCELREKCMFIVCLTVFLFNRVSTTESELRESACLLCLIIFFSILSPTQMVSYVKVNVYCVFD